MIGFGNFGLKRNWEIKPISDIRLLLVDTQKDGFYDNVLNYISEDENIQDFVKAIHEVKWAQVEPFYRPVIDPSIIEGELKYIKGKRPAVGYSYNWWAKMVRTMPTIEGWNWQIGTEYEYYAFLVQLINSFVDSGWLLEKAIETVVCNSSDISYNDEYGDDFAPTGSTELFGICDLQNTFKILACTNEEVGGFWIAGSDFYTDSCYYPLADLEHYNEEDKNIRHDSSVAWNILKKVSKK